MTSDKRRCERILAEHQADVIDNSGPGELFIDAWLPPGKVWAATECHSVNVTFYTDRQAGWRVLLEDLEKGVIPCETPDCEGCEVDA